MAEVWPTVFGLEEIVVQSGCVFLLGDNRAYSLDARQLGCVPEARILGVVELYFSADIVGSITKFGVIR
jgi:type IV secretory pathway protease TraF